jgi:thiamine transport system permease protein
MAQRNEPVNSHRTSFIAAWLVTILIVALAAIPLLTLLGAAENGRTTLSLTDPYIVRVLRFTLMQAALSASLSIVFAMPITRALAKRQNFPGRELLLRLFAVPLGVPQLVAVLGIIAIYGRQGVVNGMLAAIDLPTLPAVFGLQGILLAHVFFNLPLAVRFLLTRLEAIPQENWRLAASLGFGSRDVFRHLEWPYMRTVLPGVFALIFMLCVTSFTVVLTLGGGPKATTLEVAIYQALRFDFDPALAARLAGLQISLCAFLLLVLQRFSIIVAIAPRLKMSTLRPDSQEKRGRLLDFFLIVGAGLFVLLPLAAIVVDGLKADFARLTQDPVLWRAAMWSMLIGVSASLLATIAAAILARAMARWQGFSSSVFRMAGNLVLLVPPLILAAGSFLLVHRHLDPQEFSPYAVIIINAMMALPFALPVLEPAFRSSYQAHDRLAASLGLKGFWRLRLIEWPVLRSSLALGFLVAMLVSLGEFGVIAFFGNEELITLPLFLYQRIGSYRFNDAAGIALLLLVLCLILSWLIERRTPEGAEGGS